MFKSKLLINDSQKIMSIEKYIMFVIPMQAKSHEMKVIHIFRIENSCVLFKLNTVEIVYDRIADHWGDH